MPAFLEIHEDEIDQLKRDLDQLIERIQTNVSVALEKRSQQAVETMQADHEADAHDIQRYVNRTWNLTDSIEMLLTPWREEGSVNTLSVTLSANATYAEDVEFGTDRSAPYPFFYPEIYTMQDDALAPLFDAFLQGFRDMGMQEA